MPFSEYDAKTNPGQCPGFPRTPVRQRGGVRWVRGGDAEIVRWYSKSESDGQSPAENLKPEGISATAAR
jgi:hypothetical protein